MGDLSWLVFGKDGRCREAVFVAEGAVAQIFLSGQFEVRPACGADTDDSAGTDAFDDQVRFKSDLDAAAPQRDLSGRLCNVENGAS